MLDLDHVGRGDANAAKETDAELLADAEGHAAIQEPNVRGVEPARCLALAEVKRVLPIDRIGQIASSAQSPRRPFRSSRKQKTSAPAAASHRQAHKRPYRNRLDMIPITASSDLDPARRPSNESLGLGL